MSRLAAPLERESPRLSRTPWHKAVAVAIDQRRGSQAGPNNLGSDSMSRFIFFSCPCGRTLRATKDQAGTEVPCWNCQRTHVVPVPGTGKHLAREWFDGAGDFLRFESLFRFLVGGLVIASALVIPVVGTALGLTLLALAAGLYPEVVRRSGGRNTAAAPGPDWRARVSCIIWGPVLALGLTSPILLRHVVMDRYGLLLSWRGRGVAAVAAACWLTLPLMVMLTSAGDRTNPRPVGRVLGALWRHPWATSAALLVLPVGMFALEALLVGASLEQDWFPYLVLDQFPNPASDRVALRLENDFSLDPNFTPLSFYWGIYIHGLKLGYTLIGALPAALPRGPVVRARPWFTLVSDWHYPAVRALHSALILSGVGVLAAIQARWLGLIATVDSPSTVRSGVQDGT
jgi:hypothetical protein